MIRLLMKYTNVFISPIKTVVVNMSPLKTCPISWASTARTPCSSRCRTSPVETATIALFLLGPVAQFFVGGPGLGDPRRAETGPGELLRHQQADERAAEAEHERPEQQRLVHRVAKVDAEGRQHHLDQDGERDGKGDEDQNVGEQQQADSL